MRPAQIAAIVAITLFAAAPARSDAGYQETSQMTGGSLLRMTQSLPLVGHKMKSLSDPIVTQVYVSGDRMARVDADTIEITDLHQKEFIHIDKQKRTYTITTFEQAEQAVRNAGQQMQQAQQQQQPTPQNPNNVKLSYSFNVKETGETQTMEGGPAREVLITSQLNATSDTQPGEATMEMTNDVWLLDSEPAGYKEVRDFEQRLGTMLASGIMANGNPFASNPMIASKPGASDTYAGMADQMKKLNGFSVMEVTRIGATSDGQPLPPPQPASAAAASQPSVDAGAVAKDAAVSGATAEANHQISKAVPFGSTLGHFGGFGHKKQAAETQPTPAQPAAQAPPADPVLMEITTKKSTFSTDPVPASVFEIPAGYTQVVPPPAAPQAVSATAQ
ncbi:MAG TPA: hypothetical protein VJS11_15125 [Acidobacteriaceae bacterium]|nr:hypothetical protein [Acidobacteriaceae bacterium]